MKQSKDPFEAAYEEQEESPPDSPAAPDYMDNQTTSAFQSQVQDDSGDAATAAAATATATATAAVISQSQDDDGGDDDDDDDDDGDEDHDHDEDYDVGVAAGSTPIVNPSNPSSSSIIAPTLASKPKTNKEDDYEEEDDNMDAELSKFPSTSDPSKMVKMQAILSRFTEAQMSRYESFRRSALQKANMRRLLVSITGTQKISLPMTIVVCGIAKMFVGELVETARIVMSERNESGPIRPCHIREAYRRLKLEGKVPKRTVPRLFR